MKHTAESKDKIRRGRIAYLSITGNSAWKQSNKKFSIPCEKWKNYLRSNSILFIEEYQPLLHKKRFFSIDIAFPEKRIGIEINGGQHYDSNGKLKPYYQSRHELIESEGWKLYEIPYYLSFNSNLIDKTIKAILVSPDKICFDYFNYKPRVPKIKIKKIRKPLIAYPNIKDILDLFNAGKSGPEIATILNVPYKSLHAFQRRNNISLKRSRKLTPSELNPNWRTAPKLEIRTKIRPSRSELAEMVQNQSVVSIAKIYDTTDNNIRKWCKSENIEIPKFARGFWLRSGRSVGT